MPEMKLQIDIESIEDKVGHVILSEQKMSILTENAGTNFLSPKNFTHYKNIANHSEDLNMKI